MYGAAARAELWGKLDVPVASPVNGASARAKYVSITAPSRLGALIRAGIRELLDGLIARRIWKWSAKLGVIVVEPDRASAVELSVAGKSVRISSPGRVYFSARGETKLDLARYYLSVGDGIVRALNERPCMLHRFPRGVDGEKVHQKRLPSGAPPWVDTVRVDFPSGRHADELCVTDLASVIWAVQMATVEFHPWNSRRSDIERPDEWRIDLDPMPQCQADTVRRVARVAHEVLDELGAVGWPKTSGGSGLHIYVRIQPRWSFSELRRAALAFAREVERRVPEYATTTWWRKDRELHKVFVDYNQNARDHTIASAYSVRGVKEATVSTPITWDEIDAVMPQDCTIATVPDRFAKLGDLHEGINEAVFSIETLLEWAEREEGST
jgi:DNA ligase D